MDSFSDVSTVSTDISKAVSSPDVSNKREQKFIVGILMDAEEKKRKVYEFKDIFSSNSYSRSRLEDKCLKM